MQSQKQQPPPSPAPENQPSNSNQKLISVCKLIDKPKQLIDKQTINKLYPQDWDSNPPTSDPTSNNNQLINNNKNRLANSLSNAIDSNQIPTNPKISCSIILRMMGRRSLQKKGSQHLHCHTEMQMRNVYKTGTKVKNNRYNNQENKLTLAQLQDLGQLGKVVYERVPSRRNWNWAIKTENYNNILQNANKIANNSNSGNCTICFDSRFQSGNLDKVYKNSSLTSESNPNTPQTYTLLTQNDTNTFGYNQWFYFRAKSSKLFQNIRFQIINMRKNFSSFNRGMKIAVFNQRKWKQQKIGWHRAGSNIEYSCNNLKVYKNSNQFLYTLGWEYIFDSVDSWVYFAYSYPYTYTELKQMIAKTKKYKNGGDGEWIQVCLSSLKNPIYMLKISNTQKQKQKQIYKEIPNQQKKPKKQKNLKQDTTVELSLQLSPPKPKIQSQREFTRQRQQTKLQQFSYQHQYQYQYQQPKIHHNLHQSPSTNRYSQNIQKSKTQQKSKQLFQSNNKNSLITKKLKNSKPKYYKNDTISLFINPNPNILQHDLNHHNQSSSTSPYKNKRASLHISNINSSSKDNICININNIGNSNNNMQVNMSMVMKEKQKSSINLIYQRVKENNRNSIKKDKDKEKEKEKEMQTISDQQTKSKQLVCQEQQPINNNKRINFNKYLKDNKTTTNTNTNKNQTKQKQKQKQKQILIIMARVHPGQTPSSFVIEGVINSLLKQAQNQNQFKYLKNNLQIYIIPMLNPDGVIHGNTRTSLTGNDLNRRWGHPHPALHPQIKQIKQYFQNLINNNNNNNNKQAKIFAVVDLHAHTKKQSAFFYGCCDKKNYHSHAQVKLLNTLMGKVQHNFNSLFSSHFVGQSKRQTARVTFYNEFKCFSYTLQSSFLGQDQSSVHFSVMDYYNIGKNLLKSLAYLHAATRGYARTKNILNDPSLNNPILKQTIIQHLQRNKLSKNKQKPIIPQNQQKRSSGSSSAPSQCNYTQQFLLQNIIEADPELKSQSRYRVKSLNKVGRRNMSLSISDKPSLSFLYQSPNKQKQRNLLLSDGAKKTRLNFKYKKNQLYENVNVNNNKLPLINLQTKQQEQPYQFHAFNFKIKKGGVRKKRLQGIGASLGNDSTIE